jgi:hypothetical protein
MAAQKPARKRADVARTDGLDQAQQNRPHHRPGEVANAAKYRCSKGFEARQKAHGVLCGAIVGCVHHTGNRSQHGANHEGGRNHHIRFHAHKPGHARVFGRGTHGAAELGVVHQPHQHR